MNTKAVLFLVVVLMAFVTVQEAHAFTAGGGGNIPGAGKREFMVVSIGHFVGFLGWTLKWFCIEVVSEPLSLVFWCDIVMAF